MDRLTFDKIRKERPPEGDEVLHFVEAQGFRVVISPGMLRPVLACSPDTPMILCLEIEELVLDHAEAVFLAADARRRLYAAVRWSERVAHRQ